MTDELRALTFWLPVRIVNGLNAREHWTVDAKRARIQRDAVCAGVLAAIGRRRLAVGPAVPKRVHCEAFVWRVLDGDGLQAALKHVRDGLIDAGVLDGDAPRHGHRFTYSQAPAPLSGRGVRITITLAEGSGRAKDSDAQA